jgi:hypothetical protein
MIRLPSNIKPYLEYWSEDPAFRQRPTDGDATEYETKLSVAVETGNWSDLRLEGAGEPTAFTVRVLSSEQLGKISDMRKAGTGDYEFLTMVFRLSLQSIAPFDGPKLEHASDDELGRMVSLEWMERAGLVGAPGLRLIGEIGTRVFLKSMSLGPK